MKYSAQHKNRTSNVWPRLLQIWPMTTISQLFSC